LFIILVHIHNIFEVNLENNSNEFNIVVRTCNL
jgi:hypothetical protein